MILKKTKERIITGTKSDIQSLCNKYCVPTSSLYEWKKISHLSAKRTTDNSKEKLGLKDKINDKPSSNVAFAC